MKVIRLRHDKNDLTIYAPRYAGTLGDAKKFAAVIPKHLRGEVVAEEINVQTDKAGIVTALNGEPTVSIPFRTWGVTARGALKAE